MRRRIEILLAAALISLIGGQILVLGAKIGNDKPRASVPSRIPSKKGAGVPTDPVKELIKQEALLLEQMDRKEEDYLKQYLKPPNSRGVRAPVNRNLRVFFPVSSRPASSAVTEEEDEPKVDTSAILSAHSERSKRLLQSSSFTSTNSRELARRRRTTVFPYILLRVRFPDGMLVQARFGLNETVKDVFDVVGKSLAPEYAGASFSLLSLGGARRMLFRRNGAKEANLRLDDCGLAPPAATLMLRWDGPTPDKVKTWVGSQNAEEGDGEEEVSDRDSCSEGGWPCAWAVVVREDLALAAKDRHAQDALPDDVPLGFKHSGGEEEHRASKAAALESKLAKHFGL